MHFLLIAVGSDWEREVLRHVADDEAAPGPENSIFVDEEDQHRLEYETASCPCLVLRDGTGISPKGQEASRFYRRLTPSEHALELSGIHARFRFVKPCAPGEHEAGHGVVVLDPPAGSAILERSHKERYATFEDYMRRHRGEERDDHTGRYGFWWNLNAMCDWYMVGGRWSGYFAPKFGGAQVDQIRKGDFDLERMGAEAAAEGVLVPYALLVDGLWHEQDEDDCPRWQAFARETLAALPDATLLTVVDCHR